MSTSGIIPRIYDFADEDIQINFAVSLHGANDEIRSRLMPINRAYNVEKLMEAIHYYQEKQIDVLLLSMVYLVASTTKLNMLGN